MNPSEYDEKSYLLMNTPSEHEYDQKIPVKDFISKQIEMCDTLQSYTHGIHRSLRWMMDKPAKDLYKNWLTYLELDSILVEKYVG